jgi:uncharacterized protein (TIGR02391 family)
MTYNVHIEAFRNYYLLAITEADLEKVIHAHNIGSKNVSIPGEDVVHFGSFQRMRIYANDKDLTRDQIYKVMQADAGGWGQDYWRGEVLKGVGREVTREKMSHGFGELKVQLEMTGQAKTPVVPGLWDLLHPKVVQVSRKLFEGGHFKQAAQEALTAVDERVGAMLVGTLGERKTGKDRMLSAFGEDSPLIRLFPPDDPDARMMQEGYKFIFAGVMLAIRNPKSHRNFEIGERDAVEILFLASRLLRTLEEAQTTKGI